MNAINQMLDSIHTDIIFKKVCDADLQNIGSYCTNDPIKLEQEGLAALNAAKPFPLTGKIKTDARTLVSVIREIFSKSGIELGTAIVDSPNFANEIQIPIGEVEGLILETMIDYEELASNGSGFVIQLSLSSLDFGTIKFVDLDDHNSIQVLIDKLKSL
jgi:hypothetical protein